MTDFVLDIQGPNIQNVLENRINISQQDRKEKS